MSGTIADAVSAGEEPPRVRLEFADRPRGGEDRLERDLLHALAIRL